MPRSRSGSPAPSHQAEVLHPLTAPTASPQANGRSWRVRQDPGPFGVEPASADRKSEGYPAQHDSHSPFCTDGSPVMSISASLGTIFVYHSSGHAALCSPSHLPVLNLSAGMGAACEHFTVEDIRLPAGHVKCQLHLYKYRAAGA